MYMLFVAGGSILYMVGITIKATCEALLELTALALMISGALLLVISLFKFLSNRDIRRRRSKYALVVGIELSAMVLILVLGGCSDSFGTGKEELVLARVSGYDHNTHETEAETVTGFSVKSEFFDGEIGSDIGGQSCCINFPKNWKPGMVVTVHWGYNNAPDYKDPPPQSDVAEIPEYLPNDLNHLDVHFYPGHKIKVVVTKWSLGSPFYPLSKEDWRGYPVDQHHITNYKLHPGMFEPLSWMDLKWARQWGIESENKEK